LLRLNLFGAPSITADGAPLAGRAAHGRRLALLALLACTRGRSLRRDRIMALLWPESPTERARAQLSDDLYILRSGLGEDVVRSASDEIALNADAIGTDVALFEQLLEEGQREQAVALVAGPLLEGFHLPDSPEFERWLDAEQARFAARYAAALESLAEAAEAAGDFATASAWWLRLAAHDPYSGRITLCLMRALDANGDRAGAMRHARVHTTLLREELDAAPDPDVIQFAERLRVGPPPGPTEESAPAAARAQVAVAHMREGAGEAAEAPVRELSHLEPVPRTAPAGRPVFRYATAAIVLLALAIVGVDALTDAPPQASRTAPSIAVLPFVNLSADPDNAYFSDGLTEQIIATLSRVEGLRVAARTSSFRLRDRSLDVRSIGDTLGVATVLEGSVRREGDRLRVTAQLIDAATGYHLWTEEYDRQPDELIDVQAEIAGAIAHALRLRLTPASHNAPAPDLEAYDFYLRALYLRNTLKPDELGQALDFFDRAIAREPTFALAYAGKATVVAPAILFGYMPQEEGMSELRALVDRALELDPTLGEAHTALGIVRLFWDWDWEGAERSLRRAVALNPSDAHAFHHLANYFNVMGMLDDAVAARSRSVDLDPLNARTVAVLAADYLRLGDYERALELYGRAMKLDPVHPLLLGSGPWLPGGPGNVYQAQGRHREAVDEYTRLATLRGATPAEVDALRDAFNLGGMPAFWRGWLAMDQRQMPDLQDPLRTAQLWLLSGDTAQAFDWLDRAFEERNPGLVMIRGSPLGAMSSHPRVARIIAAMKLPRS
jgi:TolB-like protein/DNA-binding SARP family transcriptional activator/Tfp pilus assembly protein PilF